MDIRYINHRDLTDQELNIIIEFKDKVWKHGYDKQLDWFKENVADNDIHALYYQDDTLLSYLLLVPIEIEINNEKKSGYGVSTVCSVEKGKGYGKSIMNIINDKIKEDSKVGLLFCHLKNIAFYQKCNWHLVIASQIKVEKMKIDNKLVFVCIYDNYNLDKRYRYEGKIF